MKKNLVWRVLGMLAIAFIIGGVFYAGNLALKGI